MHSCLRLVAGHFHLHLVNGLVVAPKIDLNPHTWMQSIPTPPARRFRVVECPLNSPGIGRSPQAPIWPPWQFRAAMKKPQLMDAPLFIASACGTGLHHAKAMIFLTGYGKDPQFLG